MTAAYILSAEEMGRADRQTIESGISGLTLMERAGAAVVEEIEKRWAPRRVVVLAGPGNNGADGFVIARLLSEKKYDVTVAAMLSPKEMKGDAGAAAKSFEGKVVELSAAALEDKALVVDALFGTGLSKPLEEVAGEVAEALAAKSLPVVAVDIPSGVNGSTGAVQSVAVKAELTVTFESKKIGHVLLPGKSFAGELVVKSIGILPSAVESLGSKIFENSPILWLEKFPWPKPEGHKYHRGYATVVGGDEASTGAARLAALAALRVGAGLVAIACPISATSAYASFLQAVMTKPMKDIKQFESFLRLPHRDAVLVGPGSGVTARTRNMALAALKQHKRVVLDADALSVFEAMPEQLFSAIKANGAPVVLTPHTGEFRKVFDTLDGESKIALARKAAALSGAVVLLKGNDTVIADPGGRVIVNTNAPATLATAGAGDVLAGMILGLIAGGMDGLEAAAAATWIHGEAARRFGFGLIAEDIAAQVPYVLSRLADQADIRI